MIITGISLFSAFRSVGFVVKLISIFISGVGKGGVFSLLTISYLQASTNPELRGRVFGNFYTIGRLALLISFFYIWCSCKLFRWSFQSRRSLFSIDRKFNFDIYYWNFKIFLLDTKEFLKGNFGIERSNFNKIKFDLDKKEN
ncbi:MAG: hypothetical protein Ct9H90mP10_00410 [Actinomycetota bacterium]|nr:MAG: hypothetical protein Ct9H90mP10_00410 [Actinomycetota bacterium]